jgi:rhomboid family GlyGly-CTERM serine protease
MSKINRILPLIGFAGLLLISNLNLFRTVAPSALIFRPELVASGEWWRLFTHPFVHVSWYHLLLDSIGVMVLWAELTTFSLLGKTIAAVSCGAGSVLFATCFSPRIGQTGFCGLSGVAHGLMFLVGLCWIWQAVGLRRSGHVMRSQLLSGLLFVLVSGGKAVYEVVSGDIVFSALHMGVLGVPIVHSHLGGIAGGGLAFVLLVLFKKK